MTNEEAIKYLKQLYPNGGHCWLDEQRIEAIGTAVKALQEEPTGNPFGSTHAEFRTAVESLGISQEEHDRIVDECIYGKEPELVDADDLPKEEPASEMDFEQELYKAFGQVKDFTLGMRIAKWFYDMGKKNQEHVSEDLGEYINKLSKQFPEVSFAKLSRIAVRVAKWQKAKMVADAIDVEVKVDAGGYPYIDKTIELYDYDKDIPLAKEGDKYKVVLIKED